MGRCLQTWLSLARNAGSLNQLHSPAQHGRGVRTSACLSMEAFDAIKAPTHRSALLAFHSDNQVCFHSAEAHLAVMLRPPVSIRQPYHCGLPKVHERGAMSAQEVDMPEKHRFPMRKYRLTREALQADPALQHMIEVREVMPNCLASKTASPGWQQCTCT